MAPVGPSETVGQTTAGKYSGIAKAKAAGVYKGRPASILHKLSSRELHNVPPGDNAYSALMPAALKR
jgi:hypothetical protein